MILKLLLVGAVALAAPLIAPAPPKRAGDIWVGEYYDRAAGAVTTIRAHRDGIHSVHLETGVSDPDCTGDLMLRTQLPGDIQTFLVADEPQGPNQCRITLRRDGGTIVVRTDNCSDYSGMRCGFDGIYKRTGR